MRILITGGAGFVGSSLARAFRRQVSGSRVVVLDNLKRRGSELNAAAFKREGIEFHHGDVRVRGDLERVPGNFDFLIDASAEPSVLGQPDDVLDTNLVGTIHCVDWCERRAGGLVFLSTSRVYSIPALRGLPLEEGETRLELVGSAPPAGASERGISEAFSVSGPRSFYGTTKLASEMIIEEYVHARGLKAVINRCGVIAGPGQFGKSDQGVFTMWVANHVLGKPLTYVGFGGLGKQVRDLLHPSDLFTLVRKQCESIDDCAGVTVNVGGGQCAVSLAELTTLCREVTGRTVPIGSRPETHPFDIPYYVTDYSLASARFDWRPSYGAKQLVSEIAEWVRENQSALSAVFES